MSAAKKILSNTAAQMLGKIITAIIALFTVNLLSRYFSVSQYGDYGTIYEFLAFFGAIADMGVYTLLLREMSKNDDSHGKKMYGTGVGLRIVLGVLAMSLAVLVAFSIPKYSQTYIPWGVIVAGIATFFVIMSGTVSVVLQVKWKMHFFSFALVLGKMVSFLGVIATTIFFPEPTAEAFFWILFAGLFGSFLTFVISFFFSQKHFRLQLSFDRKKMQELFLASLPFGIAMILGTLYFRLGFLMLSVLLPRSENGECLSEFCGDLETGKYLVSLRMMEVLLLFPIFFMNSAMPLLVKKMEEKAKELPKIFANAFLFLFALGLPIAVGSMVLSTPIAGTLADEKLLSGLHGIGADTAFAILAFPLFFAFLNSFFSFSLISLGRQFDVLKINGIALSFNALGNFVLIPMFGLLGSAISTFASEVLMLGISIWFFKKHIPMPFLWSAMAKVSFAATLMGIFCFFFYAFFAPILGKIFTLLLSIVGAIVLFYGVLFVTKFFTKEMLAVLKKEKLS